MGPGGGPGGCPGGGAGPWGAWPRFPGPPGASWRCRGFTLLPQDPTALNLLSQDLAAPEGQH